MDSGGNDSSYRSHMARHESPTVERARRRRHWIIGLLTIPVAVLAVFAAGIVVAVLLVGVPHLEPTSRSGLEPIPIAPSACPYVSLMHTAANNFQAAEPAFGFALDEHGNQLTWPQTRARLDQTLKALSTSIRASMPYFPAEVRAQLGVATDAIREGRKQLALAKDGKDLSVRTTSVFDRGTQAFGSASDLIGDQCGVRLGADPRR